MDTEKNKNTVVIFLIFTILSFAMHYFQELSILKYSFKIFETFQHEIGHGYTSMLFGGQVVDLHLEYNQGHVTHMTPIWSRPFVSFSGYLSASLFGFLIYASSLYASKFLKIVLILSSMFWYIYVDGIMTFLILTIIIATFIASWFLNKFGCYLLRFIGVYIMVSSIYSPTYLWAYSDSGDHVSLFEQTFIPPFVWICIWFVIGCFFLYQALNLSLNIKKDLNDGTLQKNNNQC